MIKKLVLTLLIFSLIQSFQFLEQLETQNKKPVIGVYTQPAHFDPYWNDEYQYILQDNVQFIENAGGQVVAIPYNGTDDQLIELFNGINGLFFTGGGMDLDINTPVQNTTQEYNVFLRNAAFLIELAKEANNKGDFFPVWGTCQGFEIMNIVQADNEHSVLKPIEDDENVPRAGVFNSQSRLFEDMSADLLNYAMTNNILFYYHEWAVFPYEYVKFDQLSEFYDIIGYSTNGKTVFNGIPYVAAIEGKNYPFYAVQFHPEITLYDNNKNTNTTPESLEFAAHFGLFFIKQAKKNTHKYDLHKPLLYAATTVNFKLVEFPEDFFQYIYFIKNSVFDV
ncbi:hypothetical protein PPERSA_03809 [Pseudocohnilembus persalinus]|uniref:folate gamma-glutamyl hydrolase n=1 Tax=Pseudocohnilembus persalinus TaxID=266149 RepID=A0A0V0QV61_PSEPJ|nr:hypothetical protein PPERSA_03809 [Pseudocohnilembus persalinus]|eukprot:KRX05872.1 hypothetical protein PPERSA_03809 [Pseudocohnilembus persalinus]